MKTFEQRKESVQQYMENIKRKRRKTAVIATSLTLVVTILALVLFVPYSTELPSVSRYAGNEYYGVIQRINQLSYEPPRYKNNFDAMLGFFSDYPLTKGDMMPGEAPTIAGDVDAPIAAPEYGMDSSTGQYVEVTDNQVVGVTEADIFKRTDKYVYYLRKGELFVYTIAKDESICCGSYDIYNTAAYEEDSLWELLQYRSATEMYLSADGSTVTVLVNGGHKTLGAVTVLVSLDVTDSYNIKQISRIFFTGDYISSRVMDGEMLLCYNYRFSLDDVDFDDPSTFVPKYGTPDNMTCIPGNAIVCPDDVTAARYTVVCKLDGKSLEVKGSAALMGYSQDLYVSQDTIYATRSFTLKEQAAAANQYRVTNMTQITGISYSGDGLEMVGTIEVEGSVKDQYSMDQYEGILRVVTSTSVTYRTESIQGDFTTVRVSQREKNVNLYCIDLENWQIAAQVLAFAPEGEDAQSVRFDGTKAYVCTAEVIILTDPVYFFDLSDLDNITWTDTGTIEGYSTSLIQLGDGYLLGVGYGEDRGLKIEVYEEYNGQVVSVCTYERQVYFSEVYKSYLIDRENNLFGIALGDWKTGELEYVLLHFDGYKLQEVARIRPMNGHTSTVRAFLADGWLYVLTYDYQGIHTQQVW